MLHSEPAGGQLVGIGELSPIFMAGARQILCSGVITSCQGSNPVGSQKLNAFKAPDHTQYV